MKLEEQVISLDLAKKLKFLNVKQDSLFYWFDHESHRYLFCKYYEQYSPHVNLNIDDGYSAFTVAELLQKMPLINGCPFQLLKGYNFGDTFLTYCGRFDNLYIDYSTMESLPDKNPVNAMAKMLIYLIENGLCKL